MKEFLPKLLLATLSVALMASCASEEKTQKQWIYDNLPTKVWQDVTYDRVNSEYQRLSSSLVDLANNARQTYYDNALDEYYGFSWKSELLRNFDQISSYFGEGSYSSRIDEAMANYKEHCEEVLGDLADNMGSFLYLRDSTFYGCDYERSDKEIFEMLMGTPENEPDLSYTQEREIARGIVINTLQPMVVNKPAIASVQYNKDRKLWSVRMDNAENQYVKFYPREDGEYDVEYSSSINANGEPVTDNTITTSLHKKKASRQTMVKKSDNKEFVAYKSPKKSMFIGHWKTDIVDDDILELNITDNYIQRWYDAGQLAEHGKTKMANAFSGKTIYDCDKEHWKINDEGTLQICDDEYTYAEFKLDESKDFLIDIYHPERRYYKMK